MGMINRRGFESPVAVAHDFMALSSHEMRITIFQISTLRARRFIAPIPDFPYNQPGLLTLSNRLLR